MSPRRLRGLSGYRRPSTNLVPKRGLTMSIPDTSSWKPRARAILPARFAHGRIGKTTWTLGCFKISSTKPAILVGDHFHFISSGNHSYIHDGVRLWRTSSRRTESTLSFSRPMGQPLTTWSTPWSLLVSTLCFGRGVPKRPLRRRRRRS